MEPAHVGGLADDDVFHGVEELGACGVGGQVQHRVERVEFEHVVMGRRRRESRRRER